ncbi:MAG TPA: FGGY-family carbohydrate kinase, partial [Candidatus Eisenbacteria bacterium]|nr:FGGY-family carbohydrate kinase [Candidatus Eisenbacteria bacterium]
AALPIASLVGDQQAASFAQGCFSPGIVKNTYGTGLFIVEITGRRPRFSPNLLTTIAWSDGTPAGTEYAVEGSVFIGGAAVQWLRDGLGILKKSSDVERLAASVPSTGGVVFVPALAGLGAPYWDPTARGLIAGITRGTTRAHLARAALEAIAYQTRDVLETMKKDTGLSFRALRVDGGASADDFLMQFQADAIGIPVERPRVLETTALGAAGLAGVAVGFWKNREEFNRLRKIDRVFRPGRKAPAADAWARWKDAVNRSKGWAV